MRIIILGPTASGKTGLSLKLAAELQTAIISADSRQCYKYMNIGTAKPSSDELQAVPHYNISIFEPDEDDSAMAFQRRTKVWEKEILQQAIDMLYVGGSTLHLQSLIRPFNEMPEANAGNIAQLEERIEKEGLESPYEMLKAIDPAYIQKMNGMNRQRIIRALDVWMQTGKPFSSFHQQDELRPDKSTIIFGLNYHREELYNRINHRVDQMVESGLVQETQNILEMGYSKNLQSLNTVGYKEIIQYLNGEYTLPEAVTKIKTNTRRYAKRQLTWFRRWEFIHWLPADTLSVEEMCTQILRKIRDVRFET